MSHPEFEMTHILPRYLMLSCDDHPLAEQVNALGDLSGGGLETEWCCNECDDTCCIEDRLTIHVLIVRLIACRFENLLSHSFSTIGFRSTL